MKLKDPAKIDRIFEATLDIVEEKGLAGLTMSGIGKKSNLGMGTIYTYFKSKDEIINVLYKKVRAKHFKIALKDVDKEVGFEAKFRKIYFAWFRNRWHYSRSYHFLDQCLKSPFIEEEVIAEDDRQFKAVYQVIKEGIEEGLVRAIEPSLIINFVIGGTKEMILKEKIHKNPLTDELIETCYDAVIHAFRV